MAIPRSPKYLIILMVAMCCFGIYQFISFSGLAVRDLVFVPRQDQCQPKSNVVFAKTHKTASTSVQNIFLRYADTHQLLVALPRRGNYFGHPELFVRFMVPGLKPDLAYNVFCHHHRWNFYEIRRLMPDNAVHVTILRDPAQLFESLYSYYRLAKTYNMSLDEYARFNESLRSHHNRRFYRKIGRNQMSFDLGLSENFFDDELIVGTFIQNLDKQFLLVMIVELIDESLVLLRHLMCWTVDDVVIFHHNVRLPTKKTFLDAEAISGLLQWNRADQLLYDYFRRRLEQQITEFGWIRMKREVAELRRRTQLWYDACIEGEDTYENVGGKFRAYSKQVYGFKLKDVNNATCENLAKAEIPYTNELRVRQLPFYSPPISVQYLELSSTISTSIET